MSAHHWTSRQARIIAPARRGEITVEEIDGQVVFADPSTGAAYHLNETAYEVWRHCDGSTTTRGIAATLTKRWDIDFDTALDDVEQLVVFMAQAALIAGGDQA